MTIADREGNAMLRGGPSSQLTEDQRIVTVQNLDQVLKLPKGSHYDHYLPTLEWMVRAGRKLRVFEWSHRTYVAE